MEHDMRLITIVVPLYNEEAVVEYFAAKLIAVLDAVDYRYEIIFVNDGSADATLEQVRRLCRDYSTIKLLSLSRNFGHQSALLAGLRYARGDCAITLDGDLQHPPELIPSLIAHWKQGAKVVATRRLDAVSSPLAKRLSSQWFYRLFRLVSGMSLEPGMADFRLLDRAVLDTLQDVNERALFLRGMLQWVGFRRAVVEYRAADRAAGVSKFTPRKMLTLALDGITAFSVTPLRIATVLGFVFSLLSFAYLTYALFIHLFTEHAVEGWTSVIGSVLFLGGVQLICLGIIGEYIGKIFQEVKQRPHFVVEETIGFGDESLSATGAGDHAVRRRATAD